MAKCRATIWLAAAISVVLVAGAIAQPAAELPRERPRQILVLRSYGQHFEPFATWSAEIRSELTRRSPWPLSFQEHFLVSALTGSKPAEDQFVKYLGALYADAPPDLIVALGAPAARFVQQRRAGLFPSVPMLLAAVNARRVDSALLSAEDAVVATLVEHVPLFENILRVLPLTQTIAVIIGNSPPERLWVGQIQQELKPVLGNRVELRFFNERPFDEILQEVGHLPPRSAIFFQQMMVDGAGMVYGDRDPLKSIADVANAPIFTFDHSLFHGGVVGGPMTSPVEGARSTAAVALRMLNGEEPRNIRVPPTAFAPPVYDWRELRRWNISERLLPAGSDVVFRELGPWQRYPVQLSLVAAAILLQAGLIAVLLRERQLRHLAEVESRQRMSELARVNRFSTAGELSASIAHEINQPLGSILSNAEAAQIILESPTPDLVALKDIVGEILYDDERASEVIKRVRSLLKKAPFELAHLDLNDLTRESIEFLGGLAHARNVQLSIELSSRSIPIVGDRIQLQQVIFNLVMNAIEAMKDLRPDDRSIAIRTSRHGKFGKLSVSDRGPGIPDDKLKEVFAPFFTTKDEGMGMGLSIASTIVNAHNGNISAESRDGGGVSFVVELPLAR